MSETETTNKVSRLGAFVRATRLGYRESVKHNAFIRLGINSESNRLNVIIAPTNAKVNPNSAKFKLYIDWSKEPDMLDAIPALRNIKNPKQIISFLVDAETGELINKEAEL